ncbi:putative F-box domain-containing protein [Rosa chinensis]|uniref:Putative F-box domain-containing protein n=1 Tax=Rosa chinensis TaxID=74649 RepID=A0A2P6Q6N3_ROSCH|nr:uncharacterized protein LOC112203183 [Rosa chinensis]PRQ29833.1 putative F-box domain-containing protein [Rosa chinensis]
MSTGIPLSSVVNALGLATTTRIDDLPNFILAEILARLPRKKTVFRAKCVSRRWLSLLSDPYFVRTFLSLQGVDEGNAFIGAGILVVLPFPKNKLRPKLEVHAHPVVKTKESHFSLDFLPCFQEEKEREVRLLVAGTYNDLVLCCKSYRTYEEDGEIYSIRNPYYICNPYTKQWVALPPNHLRVPFGCGTLVGFICEPYFRYSADGKEEQTSSITLNAEYRWSVVQMVICFLSSTLELHMEIFSSETRQWKQLVVQCPPSFICLGAGSEVVAYNGMLYWLLGANNNIVDLDPMFSSDVIDQCRFGINGTIYTYMCLGVCGGRLRMCQRDFVGKQDFVGNRHLSVWEWKEEVDDNGCKMQKWCLIVDRLSINQLVLKYPLISENKLPYGRKFQVLGFHPYNEDAVFLETEHPNCIALCNMRERTLEMVSEFDPKINLESWFGSWFRSACLGSRNVYPYVIPWLPTPVPKL